MNVSRECCLKDRNTLTMSLPGLHCIAPRQSQGHGLDDPLPLSHNQFVVIPPAYIHVAYATGCVSVQLSALVIPHPWRNKSSSRTMDFRLCLLIVFLCRQFKRISSCAAQGRPTISNIS